MSRSTTAVSRTPWLVRWWRNSKKFIVDALSEDGEPSCGWILTVWLSFSSMSLIWWMVTRMMKLPPSQLQIWISGLPFVIGALAALSASPYAVNKGASTVSDIAATLATKGTQASISVAKKRSASLAS